MSVSADWLTSCTVDEALRAYRGLPPELQAEWDEHLVALTPHILPTEPPSFAEFAESTLPFALHDWQRNVLCPLIQRLAEERGLRVAIHAPPQYGKTVLLSQRAPAWLLGVDPLHRIGLACYNETHAGGFGAVVRDLMLSPQYAEMFGEASRIPKGSSEGTFFTAARRSRRDAQPSFNAMGLQSGFTGRGVDTLIIDDPYKSDEEAHSEAINDKVWRFWDATARPRIGEEANVVVMFHRYHETDLAGRLLEQGGWEYIRLPVVADDNEDGSDPSGREVGELLSPMRSQAWVDAQKRANPRVFAGQFQGRPRTDEGGIFKQAWFRYYETQDEFYILHHAEGRTERVRKEDCWEFSSVDFAASEQTAADWTVVATWAVTPRKQRLLLQVDREQMEGPEAKGLVRRAFQKRPQLAFAAIERNGLGLPMVQDLVREGWPIRPVWTHGDKVAKAQGSAAHYETGSVFHPSGGLDWVTLWENEHLASPNGSKDDQVDAGSVAAGAVQPSVGILSEFNASTHVAASPLDFDASRPLVCGWSWLGGNPAWVVGQLDARGVGGVGQFLVLAALKGTRDEGVYEFARRVLQVLGPDAPALDLRHYAHPGHCGLKGEARPQGEAWLTLNGGVRGPIGYGRSGEPEDAGKAALGIRLCPVEGKREKREEVLRARLNSLVAGLPALVVDPDCGPVLEALTGGYAFKQTLKGLALGEIELNASASIVEALSCALWGLGTAAPVDEEESELVGTASGGGRPRWR